mmetsp:Transcript_110601/g.311935  ORF Transcript_110601/g.311935 Transcript_110601/m.311935 type:complete len:203 (-) Transcript_110601:71-679(-)
MLHDVQQGQTVADTGAGAILGHRLGAHRVGDVDDAANVYRRSVATLWRLQGDHHVDAAFCGRGGAAQDRIQRSKRRQRRHCHSHVNVLRRRGLQNRSLRRWLRHRDRGAASVTSCQCILDGKVGADLRVCGVLPACRAMHPAGGQSQLRNAHGAEGVAALEDLGHPVAQTVTGHAYAALHRATARSGRRRPRPNNQGGRCRW